MKALKSAVRCDEGVHRPRKSDRLGNGQAQCRDCGCDLVPSPIGRRWRFSGVMG